MFRFGKMYEGLNDMTKKPWLGKMMPFEIIGGVYFIGTYQASCHLIDTGDGLIMIDPGYSKTAYLVIDSIYRLGFVQKKNEALASFFFYPILRIGMVSTRLRVVWNCDAVAHGIAQSAY